MHRFPTTTPFHLPKLRFLCTCILLTTFAYTSATSSAYAQSVQLTVGPQICYCTWNTNWFHSNGNVAYCLEPHQATPATGTYDAQPSDNPYLYDAMYYSYGAPGFTTALNAGAFPDTWYDGSGMDDAKYDVVSHLLVSAAYMGNHDGFYTHVSSDFSSWMENVASTFNSVTGNLIDQSGVGSVDAYNNIGFNVYIMHTGSGSQAMAGFTYHPKGAIDLEKVSANPAISDNNGCYSLEGAQYTIYADQGLTQNVATLTTDSNGYAKVDSLDAGTYFVKETNPAKGYALDGNVYQTEVTGGATTRVGGNTVSDVPQDDPAHMMAQKKDKQNDSTTPEGGATLADAQYTVKYYDGYYDKDSLPDTPTRTWVLKTDQNGWSSLDLEHFVSGDSFYYAPDGQAPVIPLGTISIQETKAPLGYLINDDVNVQQVTSDGNVENVHTFNESTSPEQVKRGDIHFVKDANDTKARMAHVPFKITSTTTGESHIVVTDDNGEFDSANAYADHTQNTNANDWALNETGTIDASALTPDSSCFFGEVAGDDTAAFPYDTYTIEELRATTNAGYALPAPQTFVVSKDSYAIDLGTMDNPRPTIATTATDAADGDHDIDVSKDMGLNDAVAYQNLVPGQTYSLTSEIHDAKTGDIVTIDGTDLTQTKTFTADEANGTVNISYTGIDTTSLAGKDLVVYEILKDGQGSTLVTHTDKDDPEQTVSVTPPTIHTQAKDGVDGDQNVVQDPVTTIVDNVTYTNVVPGKTYTVKGTLQQKITDDNGDVKAQEITDKDGNPITASATFTPDSQNGSVDVTFTFDTTGLDTQKPIVVFENLYQNDIKLCVHADITDTNQTVTVTPPSIKTVATDAADSDHTVCADAQSQINDLVSYQGLVQGKNYTLYGILMDRDSGLPILSGDGAQNVSTDTLTQMVKDAKTLLIAHDTDSAADSNTTNYAYASLDSDALTQFESTYADVLPYLVTTSNGMTADQSQGSITQTFSLDSQSLLTSDDTAKNIVAFECFVQQPNDSDSTEAESTTTDAPASTSTATSHVKAPFVCAYEADLSNTDQSVCVVPPSIHTTATDASDGDHTVAPEDDVTITDTVTYHNLIPGKEYLLHATLMDKATGNALEVGGKTVTSDLRFTPNNAEGSVDINLGAFDASSLDGDDLVVFEDLSKDQKTVAVHENLDDSDQTVHVSNAPDTPQSARDTTPASESPLGAYGKTGVDMIPTLLVILALIGGGSAASIYAYRKHMHTDTTPHADN